MYETEGKVNQNLTWLLVEICKFKKENKGRIQSQTMVRWVHTSLINQSMN